MTDITVFEEIRDQHTTKSCADCRWCELDMDWDTERRRKKWAKCQHPRGDVTGMGLGLDDYCSTQRQFDHLCGKKAKYFEKKPDPEPEEETPRKIWGKVRKLWR